MSQSSYPAEFREILRRIRSAATRADVERAIALADEAVDWGRTHGNRDAEDRGLSNRAGFLISLGRLDGLANEQRMLLMRSQDPVNRYLAAYNLSLLCDRQSRFEKGLFYARLALEQALKAGDTEFIAHAHNQVGVMLVVDSYFSDALEHFRMAEALIPAAKRLDRAIVLKNAGYCELVAERYPIGFRDLFTALRIFRSLGRGDWERQSRVRLILCYGYIEIHRLDRAELHGRAALHAAERASDADGVKHALYFLGEIAKQSGDPNAAYRRFRRLQQEHFPDNERLPDLLMQAETHRLVNLLA